MPVLFCVKLVCVTLKCVCGLLPRGRRLQVKLTLSNATVWLERVSRGQGSATYWGAHGVPGQTPLPHCPPHRVQSIHEAYKHPNMGLRCLRGPRKLLLKGSPDSLCVCVCVCAEIKSYCIQSLTGRDRTDTRNRSGVLKDKEHIKLYAIGFQLLNYCLSNLVYTWAVKRLIAINCIQNKRLCLHNICGCTVYNYFVLYIYKYTHMHVYLRKNIIYI